MPQDPPFMAWISLLVMNRKLDSTSDEEPSVICLIVTSVSWYFFCLYIVVHLYTPLSFLSTLIITSEPDAKWLSLCKSLIANFFGAQK